MTESPPQLDKPDNSFPAVARPGRRRWQFGLRTVFLLVAAIAVWMTYFINRRENASLAARIEAIAQLAHELGVDDPKQIAFVKLEDHWLNEKRWEIYLPDAKYRLCLATRGIKDNGLAPVMKSMPIAAGRHHVALEPQLDKDVWHISALWDERKLIEVTELKDWSADSDYLFGNAEYWLSEQLSPGQPAVLYRFRCQHDRIGGQSKAHAVSTDGILLWIERTGEAPMPPLD